MKKTSTSNYMRWLGTLAVLLAFVWGQQASAQNVTISPSSGSLVAGVGGANTADTGKDAGFLSTWRHEQLDLTMTGSDVGNLTQAGDLADPNCVFGVINNKHVVANGQTQTFIVVSLPKGYRITGYTIVLQPDLQGNSNLPNSWKNADNIATRFYETKMWDTGNPFSESTNTNTFVDLESSQYLARAEAKDGDYTMNPSADKDIEFTMSRTALYDQAKGSYDMGNRLYFFVSDNGNYYSFTIKSFEINFTAEGTFDAEVSPTSLGAAKNYVTSPFTTSKTTYGPVSWNEDYERYMFDYSNVKDIKAYLHLYEKDAVADNGLPQEAIGNIHPVEVDGEGHYAFGKSTYYVEPPTTVRGSSSIEGPIGFRVVGATFRTLWGTATEGETVKQGQTVKIGDVSSTSNYFYITYTSDGTTYYLRMTNTNNYNFTTNKEEAQLWTVSGSGTSTRISYTSDGSTYYLRHNNNSFSINTTNRNNTWGISGTNTLYYTTGTTTYYLTVSNASLTLSNSSSGTLANLVAAETTYEFNDNQYLSSSLIFGSSSAYGATWSIDEYGNLYIGSGEDKQYLACYGEGDTRSLSLSSVATGDMARWNLKRDDNGHLYYLSDGGNYYYLYSKGIKEGSPTNIRGFVIKSSNGEYNVPDGYTAVGTTEPTAGTEITLPSFNPGAYTLKVYDKTGKNILSNGTVTVNSESDAKETVTNDDGTTTTKWKTYEFNNFNNDAIKFDVEVANGCQALIDVTLKLEALDPYIDRMTVVCTDQAAQIQGQTAALRMTQSFTASDFGVNGGAFHFNIPAACAEDDLYITFEDLYSKYGDETYTNEDPGHARYSFVSSPYFSAFDNVAKNKVAPTHPVQSLNWNNDSEGDAGLYDERYTLYGDTISKTHKIYAAVAGDKAFKFNNAESLTSGGTLQEYPFSVEKYLSTDEGGTGGTFTQIKMKASDEEKNSGTYYLFTADETRYNIAPTTAWQHRSYAFYRMDITLGTATYTPTVEFVKVYDKNKTFNESQETKAYYGAKVTATDDDGNAGYASTDDIFKIIDAAVNGSSATGTVKEGAGEDEITIGTYKGWDANLTSAKQLLYLDFSDLAGTFQVTTDEHGSMDDYSNTNAPNCMIFLPVGASAPNNNVAYKTQSGTFRAAHNIRLTDGEPFYTPHDIQVDAASYVYYDRKVTQRYGGIQEHKASIIMPFEFVVNSKGEYLDPDTQTPMFSLHTMQPTSCLTDNMPDEDQGDVGENEAFVFFPIIESVKTKTEANKPYLLRVLNTPTDETLSFVVRQKGGTVKATIGMDADYLFAGETAKGSSSVATESTVNYTFNAYGGYSGQLLPHTSTSPTYFYFAKNKFVSSDQLLESYTTIKVLPFRSYYLTTKSTSGVKGLSELGIIFDEGIGNMDATGIEDVKANKPDLMIEVGKGYMTLTSTADQDVKVYSVSGVNVLNAKMQNGESRTVAVPGGIYIVNGAKLIVK